MRTIVSSIFVWSLTATVVIGLVTSCATWRQDADTALDWGQAACESELLRSDLPQRLVDSGLLPEVVPGIIEQACALLPAADLILQADKARSPRAVVLESEARKRGLL